MIFRQGDEIAEFLLQSAPADFFQHRDDAIGHLRLLDLRLLQERHGRIAEIDELAADRLDDPFVLIAEESNQSADLAFIHEHGRSPLRNRIHPIARRKARAPP